MAITAEKKCLPHREITDAYWVGTNICQLRRAHGLTQEKLAKSAGITSRRLREIENTPDDANPRFSTLRALAGALDVEMVDLFKHRKNDIAYQI